jgi:hypothetical protein
MPQETGPQIIKTERVGEFEQATLRPPSQVMRLERMGSFFPTRLSFLRSLLRKLAQDGAVLSRPQFELNRQGHGHAVYQITLDDRPYSLIAYSQPLAAEMRTDRVIAEAWDSCFVLFDGKPTPSDIAQLHGHATRQEAGQFDARVLVLSRANKSVRLFDHVVNCLARGHQPDAEIVGRIGYLMRTTAVYGNGKFGMADRAEFLDRPTLSHPFRLEMLTVFLIREFTLDLVEHVANSTGGEGVAKLSNVFRRQLGIGNSTGLGMAPFLVSHPILINNWMVARETALARVRAQKQASDRSRERFCASLDRAEAHLHEWQVDDVFEQKRIAQLCKDFKSLRPVFEKAIHEAYPWNRLMMLADGHSSSVQELLVALVLEPHGELVDGLCDCMEEVDGPSLDPLMPVGEVQNILAEHYDWALQLDLSEPDESALVWYVSEEKLEPRLGERRANSDERRTMPHNIVHKVQALAREFEKYDPCTLLGEVLMARPECRDIARRVQTIARHPYGEIRDNLVGAKLRPIDLLRCKLSFFGASKFDPRSDRWTRITLYQGAPTARELTVENAADAFLPASGPKT